MSLTINDNDAKNIAAFQNYEQEILKLSKIIEDLELYISEREIKFSKLLEEKNDMYISLQDKHKQVSELSAQLADIQRSYENELRRSNEEKRNIQAQADEYYIKAKRFDELTQSVVKIKTDAEKTALQLVDDAQKKSMIVVSAIENIIDETKLFELDIEHLRNDIKIGTFTLDDRLLTVQEHLNKNIINLCKIRDNFYQVNNISVTEDIYDNLCIANRNIANKENT